MGGVMTATPAPGDLATQSDRGRLGVSAPDRVCEASG
jgi:hypothetical protein